MLEQVARSVRRRLVVSTILLILDWHLKHRYRTGARRQNCHFILSR
jgi:hypothetical protein